ncbi:MAG: hypothetical protein HWE10_13265 [Gammaproteobacteria bacterium]|nr:hypothetical protein [Gammaproteobacteria bacterium]
MRHKKHLKRNASIVVLMFCSGLAQASLKSSVIDSCQAYQNGQDDNKVNACTLYIDGFIDSSLQDGSAKNDAKQQKSEYMQRVYRTRTFGRTDVETNDVAQHSFCLPKSDDRMAVAVDVAKAIDIEQLKGSDLKSVLLDTLVNRFPCSGKSIARL